MDTATSYILKEIQAIIANHDLQSGEVIIAIDDVDPQNKFAADKGLSNFFQRHDIKYAPNSVQPVELSKKKAIESIRYGFSTKPNYTKINLEYSAHDVNSILFPFMNLFSNPSFFHPGTRIYRLGLDLYDHWESGGAILIDDQKIGILWVNDLYDTFSVPK